VISLPANLGGYRLLTTLGAGGMATVYEGEHLALQKRVAVKVLRPELAASPDMRARFLREGVAASRIRHPHVVDITDVGEHEGMPYLVMELLDGEGLDAVMERAGKLTVLRAVDILLPLLAALGDAHRAGVVHRDLKPDNIFLARTAQGHAVPKILDFGISRLFGRSAAQLTAQSQILGTPDFMSPEQARGEEEVGPASDQFSIAVVLFECLTGALPHPPDTSIIRVLRTVAFGEVIPPTAYVPDFDSDLEAVLMRALAPLPAARFPNIEDFGAALLPFATPRGRAAFVSLTARHELELEEEPVSGGIFLTDPIRRTPRRGTHVEPARAMLLSRVEPLHGVAPMRASEALRSAPRVPAPPGSSRWERMAPWWAVGAGAVALALVLVLVISDDFTRHADTPLAEVIVTPASVPLASVEARRVGASALERVEDVVIRVVPSSAAIALGDVAVAVGEYRGPAPREETLVTVHAPGFVRHQFLLSGPVRREITLHAD